MIKGIIFDIDNTLTDFMRTKRGAVDAAVEMMIDAGLSVHKDEMVDKIFELYWKEGVEDQKIFNKVLMKEFGKIDIGDQRIVDDDNHCAGGREPRGDEAEVVLVT